MGCLVAPLQTRGETVRSRKFTRWPVLLFAVGLVAAGCGSDDDDADSVTSDAASAVSEAATDVSEAATDVSEAVTSDSAGATTDTEADTETTTAGGGGTQS